MRANHTTLPQYHFVTYELCLNIDISLNSNAPEPQELARSKPRTKNKRTQVSAKKVLSRKEKLEAVRKANQALMKALELISQRNGNVTDVQSDI